MLELGGRHLFWLFLEQKSLCIYLSIYCLSFIFCKSVPKIGYTSCCVSIYFFFNFSYSFAKERVGFVGPPHNVPAPAPSHMCPPLW